MCSRSALRMGDNNFEIYHQHRNVCYEYTTQFNGAIEPERSVINMAPSQLDIMPCICIWHRRQSGQTLLLSHAKYPCTVHTCIVFVLSSRVSEPNANGQFVLGERFEIYHIRHAAIGLRPHTHTPQCNCNMCGSFVMPLWRSIIHVCLTARVHFPISLCGAPSKKAN